MAGGMGVEKTLVSKNKIGQQQNLIWLGKCYKTDWKERGGGVTCQFPIPNCELIWETWHAVQKR